MCKWEVLSPDVFVDNLGFECVYFCGSGSEAIM